MFMEKIRMAYDPNTPIFTKEILKLFPEYSRAQIFRLITNSIEKGELIKFSNGVYFMPTETIIGPSTILADDVIEKRYIQSDNEVYGVYGGITLLNMFSLTTQVPNVIEIISNNESTRRREIVLDRRKFILRKSRVKISKENSGAYTILQLFSELDYNEKIDDNAKQIIKEYIVKKNISQKEIFTYAIDFPARSITNLVRSGILNEIA